MRLAYNIMSAFFIVDDPKKPEWKTNPTIGLLNSKKLI